MANYRSDLVDLSVEYLHHTDKAVLVKEGKNEVWLPLSQCETEPSDLDSLERGDEVEVTCPEWLAKDKGLL